MLEKETRKGPVRHRWTRQHPARWPARRTALSAQGTPRRGKDHAGAAVSPRRGGGRRARPLHHPLGESRRADRRRALARMDARQPFALRAPARRCARAHRDAIHDVSTLGDRAERGDAYAPRRGRAGQARSRRLRLPLGDPPPRQPAAPVSPAAPRPQAALRRQELHGPSPRRPQRRTERRARRESGPRGGRPRATRARLRRLPSSAGDRQAARRELPRRVSRLRHRARWHPRLPAPDRVRAQARIHAREGPERRDRAGPAVGRRARPRDRDPGHVGPGRSGKSSLARSSTAVAVDGRARRARRDLHVRRGATDALLASRGPGHEPSPARGERTGLRASDRSGGGLARTAARSCVWRSSRGTRASSSSTA